MTVDPAPDGGTTVDRLSAVSGPSLSSTALMAAEPGYCLFVSADGLSSRREGEPPSIGSVVELDGQGKWVVNRIGQSPLPQDRRPCAYLLPTTR